MHAGVIFLLPFLFNTSVAGGQCLKRGLAHRSAATESNDCPKTSLMRPDWTVPAVITRMEVLQLYDYRRRVSDLYSLVRRVGVEDGWTEWRETRDRLFREHPQGVSFDLAKAEGAFEPRHSYFPYDAALRVEGVVVPSKPSDSGGVVLAHSAEGATHARRVGTVRFSIRGSECELPLYWLQQYGGGVFLPFRDTTNGAETYGGGRYLLDSAKSADLGSDGGALVLDFNYAYHPSCFHNSKWSCPLAKADSTLAIAIKGGERKA